MGPDFISERNSAIRLLEKSIRSFAYGPYRANLLALNRSDRFRNHEPIDEIAVCTSIHSIKEIIYENTIIFHA